IAGAGVVLSLAASPAIAIKRGLPTYYFVERQLVFIALGVTIMLALSLLSPEHIRKVALAMVALGLALLVGVLLGGSEINGARRWVHLGSYSLQPSELAKPAFVVVSAWLLAEVNRRPDMPAMPLAVACYLAFAGLLVLQPDMGQALLVSIIWCALFFLAGGRVVWFAALLGMLAAALGVAYASLGYVQLRIDRFLSLGGGESYQAARARQSFIEGGLFGRGPGEGTIKSVLPDAHNDFIYAVIAEEYGVLVCLVLLGLFALVVVRVFTRAAGERDDFQRLGAMGLALLLALQAIINMAVNTGLLPTKGMTLPFISIGGSSTLAVGIGLGMLLALTRRRAGDLAHTKKPAFMPMPAHSESL
ncbi:MAG TPA: FtsW/RodA/SpoVE family cell cycle protein, partial [Hyphomicrobiaceae bacterium]|nr:FtsW/RodA/SpoVE family cell cycle protein [Hyphomicrobiaceae bacterium]